MTDQQLDEVYTETARMLGEVGREKAEWYLARLSLLLMLKLDDPEVIRTAIRDAREAL